MSFLHFYPFLKELKNLFKTNVGEGRPPLPPPCTWLSPGLVKRVVREPEQQGITIAYGAFFPCQIILTVD